MIIRVCNSHFIKFELISSLVRKWVVKFACAFVFLCKSIHFYGANVKILAKTKNF